MLAFIGPRGCILVWALISTRRWEQAFDGFFLPILGFFLMPWTTLAYVAFGVGHVGSVDQILIGLAVLVDLVTWAGGAWRHRDRYPGFA